MTARLRKFIDDLGQSFWLLPAAMVLVGIALAIGLVEVDRTNLAPQWLLENGWSYSGSATGARSILTAIVSSTIGVAGTAFTITIAALSLAAGQMGPRLLHNFTRDRGVQFTLGIFLAAFAYSLMVLRTVRTPDEGGFVPHLALLVAILLAFGCVATLIYFVGHMAGRINVDTVVELVGEDVHVGIRSLTVDEAGPEPPPLETWKDAVAICDDRRGYLSQLDGNGLADWAAEQGIAIRLLVRPGHYVFPGAPIAVATVAKEGIETAVRNATALGDQRVTSADLEFAVRQLVEVAVRALSPGVNDPLTAISVLDRLATALCDLVRLHLPSGVYTRDDRAVLVVPTVDYGGLTNTMFDMIRQYAAACPAVLIRMIEVLTAVASCEKAPARIATLQRHADLILQQAEGANLLPSDLQDVRDRHATFVAMCKSGPAAALNPTDT